MNYSTKSKCLLHLVCNFFSVLYFCRATLKMISPVHQTCIALCSLFHHKSQNNGSFISGSEVDQQSFTQLYQQVIIVLQFYGRFLNNILHTNPIVQNQRKLKSKTILAPVPTRHLSQLKTKFEVGEKLRDKYALTCTSIVTFCMQIKLSWILLQQQRHRSKQK